jgi:hypothetical protein
MKQTKKQSSAEAPVDAPVVAAQVDAPVAVTQQAGAAVPATKSAKQAKQSKKEVTAVEVAAPVVVAPVVQEAGAAKPKGKKASPTKEAKTAEAVPVAVPAAVQEGGAKKAAKGKAAKKAAPTKEAKKVPAKKASAPKETKAKGKAAKAKKADTADEHSEELEGGKRSFKAMLPGSDKFEGRYTGLTPYQAANKALSKYYREAEGAAKTGGEITFSIRESTRGSKRSVYTYNGRREKLEKPVEYTIKGKDGDRTVVKEYKNRLVKVKKAESQTASA